MILCNNHLCDSYQECLSKVACSKCNMIHECLTKTDYERKMIPLGIYCPFIMVKSDGYSVKLKHTKELLKFSSLEEMVISLFMRLSDTTEITIVNLSGTYEQHQKVFLFQLQKPTKEILEYLTWNK